jgi:hypothetical protein
MALMAKHTPTNQKTISVIEYPFAAYFSSHRSLGLELEMSVSRIRLA